MLGPEAGLTKSRRKSSTWDSFPDSNQMGKELPPLVFQFGYAFLVAVVNRNLIGRWQVSFRRLNSKSKM